MSIPGTRRIASALQAARARRIWRRLAGPRLLDEFAERYPEAFFVEVGSNDGDHFDHLRGLIRGREWRGIMVEPVPYVFERLRGNYGDLDRVELENAAIADHDGHMTLYHLREAAEGEREHLPSWYDAIGSFSREAVLNHTRDIPDIEERLVEAEVPCLTFDSLCRKHGVEGVDLLVVDTEGYDYELLRSIDLAAHHPRLVVYEHFHLSPGDRRDCSAYLEDQGYETMEEGFDTFCLDTRPDDDLTRAWAGLRPAMRGLSAADEQDRTGATH
jgi:FkbM family methyltransferase